MYPETYDWYMSNISSPMEKLDGRTRSASSHHGVDELWYVDPFMVRPEYMAKYLLRRTLTTVAPNVDRTMEALEMVLPRLIRYRGLPFI